MFGQCWSWSCRCLFWQRGLNWLREISWFDFSAWLLILVAWKTSGNQKPPDNQALSGISRHPGACRFPDEECIWHSDVILKHGDQFLYVLVSFFFFFFSKPLLHFFSNLVKNHLSWGTKGRKNIKATTLQEYMMLFTWCITWNLRGPNSLLTNGTFLLSKKGVLKMLNDQLYHSMSATFTSFFSSFNFFYSHQHLQPQLSSRQKNLLWAFWD